jgi:4-phospho-D-threonate 3-dehydrogenase / 4-phospho-D-erythronate 3-dehydrogenase
MYQATSVRLALQLAALARVQLTNVTLRSDRGARPADGSGSPPQQRVLEHTGLLAEQCGTTDVSMLLVGDRLRVAHVTTHVAFDTVPARITRERVATVIGIAGRTLQGLGFDRPRIAVAGLNPHAGEHGLFGDQETTTLIPAIEDARAGGWDVTGPESPDSVFGAAVNGRFDVVVAMYHDQGHIPVKLIEFDRAVNISGGLPIVRTSVDHGTAFDIAGRGMARTENLEVALELAGRLGTAHRAARDATGRV